MGLFSDERLARHAAQGDQRAFEAIYRRYHQRLYRFCLGMVGNPQDAQDALQNAMIKALRALPGEKRTIHLQPWLYRIARNESIELLRRRRESGELDEELVARDGVVETAEARQKLRELLADLDDLPERQRAVLVMRELSGLGFAEIGEAFGTSAAAARQTLYEARLSLRQLEEGREMRCADATRELSDGDGRMIRRREIRAHLRDCPDCRAFGEAIGRRRNELAAIAPLPLAASVGLLHGILGSQAGASVAGAGAGAGAGTAGTAIATSTIVKSAATVAVATVVGVSAADRGGLIDVRGNRGDDGASAVPGPPGLPDSSQAVAPGAPPPSPALESAAAAKGGLPSSARLSERVGGARKGTGNAGKGEAMPSGSAAGTNPPGGGYGSTAAERRGRPDALPPAAAHGQQRAAARRAAHTGSPPRKQAEGGRKAPARRGSGTAKPRAAASPPKTKVLPTPAPPPPPPHPLVPPTEKSASGAQPVEPPAEASEP